MADKKKIYLDYAATTPLDQEVAKAMEPYWKDMYGNASSIHALGQQARVAIDNAREIMAGAIGASWQEIVFTGSATESDNFAIRGVVNAYKGGKKPHIVTSAIEHNAILDTCKDLEDRGIAEVTYINPDKEGIISPKDVEKAIKDNTILVSIMYANNEIGTIQPIAEIAKVIKSYNLQPKTYNLIFHTDAVQAFNYLSCDVNMLGVDLLTLSAHKIYGPKGVGLLYIRKGTPILPVITGGGQERGFRGGTENVPGIVGFAKATEIAIQLREEESERLVKIRDYMIEELEKRIRGIVIQGSRKMRLPNNVNIRIPNSTDNTPVISLDQKGILVSSGSACVARAVNASHVILALGVSKEDAPSTIRMSFGRQTSKEDIDYTINVLESL